MKPRPVVLKTLLPRLYEPRSTFRFPVATAFFLKVASADSDYLVAAYSLKLCSSPSRPFKARGLSVAQSSAEKAYVEKHWIEKIAKACPTLE